MSENLKKMSVILLNLVLCISLCACGSSVQKTDETSKNVATEFHVATLLVAGYTPIYIIKDKGWLQDALTEAGYNIKVTFTEFEAGAPENEAFATGTQDVGVMGNVPAISGIASGQKRDIIGIAYNGEETLGILVQSDSTISSIKELEGKKVGIPIGTISHEFLSVMLESAGLTLDSVELINLGVSELEIALATKQIDAAALWNPQLLQIQANGTGKLLADGTGLYAGENVIVCMSEFAENNPDIVRIFMEQYKRAADDLLANKEMYANEYAESFGLTPDLLVDTWINSNFPIYISQEAEGELQRTSDFLYENGLVSNHVNMADFLREIKTENE